jgi:hypothetical protein
MSVIHALANYASGGLSGVQASQRDWSPYLVHFTSAKAMKPLRSAIKKRWTPKEIREAVAEADTESFEIVKSISSSSELRVSSPSEKYAIPKCVCLSECTLPGLISHAGRFGFVFEKLAIAKAGGAPCLYLLRDDYTKVSKAFKGSDKGAENERVWGLANLLEPAGLNQRKGKKRRKVQDFTHEREWRVFRAIDLKKLPPVALLAPSAQVSRVSDLGLKLPVIPIDVLHAWGA